VPLSRIDATRLSQFGRASLRGWDVDKSEISGPGEQHGQETIRRLERTTTGEDMRAGRKVVNTETRRTGKRGNQKRTRFGPKII